MQVSEQLLHNLCFVLSNIYFYIIYHISQYCNDGPIGLTVGRCLILILHLDVVWIPLQNISSRIYFQIDPLYVCSVADCGILTDPVNGGVNTNSGTGYLDVAAYSCLNGYELIGSNVRTCQATGSWTDAAPICLLYGKIEWICIHSTFLFISFLQRKRILQDSLSF